MEFEITYKFKYRPDPEDYKDYNDGNTWENLDPQNCLDIDVYNCSRNPHVYLPENGVEVSGRVLP